jgi:uncharacterized protein YndB with AHSA1/START domain
MSEVQQYQPGPAFGAHVKKDGDNWTLILVRELRHAPEKVWLALTDPEHLRQWAPFDADRSLGTVGPVLLTTIGKPGVNFSEGKVTRADAPNALEFTWMCKEMRWELEPLSGGGTRLTLWHNIDRGYISWGAAGWHICFDLLDQLLRGTPIARIVGPEAMKSSGWQRLTVEYAKMFDVEAPNWPSKPAQTS